MTLVRQKDLRLLLLRCALLAAALWCVLPPRVAWAATHRYNISPSSATVECTQAGDEYIISGTGSGFAVRVAGGSEANPIYVTLDGLTVENGKSGHDNAPLQVESGYCVVRLRGNNKLVGGWHDIRMKKDTGVAGLRVLPGATCAITSADGNGSTSGYLYAACSHDDRAGAGIGSNYDEDTGTIIICGGTIEAQGGHCGAGIGSGRDGVCNTISISGGRVTARGGEYAAGIGAGDAVGTGSGGTARHIYISGGTITATGGNNGGAGIGGSEGGSVDGIHITGGTITATGGGSAGSAAGIGSGDGAGCGTEVTVLLPIQKKTEEDRLSGQE